MVIVIVQRIDKHSTAMGRRRLPVKDQPNTTVSVCVNNSITQQQFNGSLSRTNHVSWHQAFSVAGPMAWNALPDDLRDPSLSADNFRKKLKTHLFRNALGHLAH